MPASRRGDRRRRVQVIRQRDVDRVDVRAIDRGAPVGGRLFPSPALRHRRERRGIPPAQQRAADAIRQIEEVPGLAVGVRMGLAHEALPEEGDAQFGFHGVVKVQPAASVPAASRHRLPTLELEPGTWNLRAYSALLFLAAASQPSVLPCCIDSSASRQGSAA